MTDITPNPVQPGIASEVFLPDQLIAGNLQLVTQPIKIKSGEGVLKRGTPLGASSSQDFVSVAAKPATGAANTGDATIGTITRGSSGYTGALVATMTDATHANVTDNDGTLLGVATAGVAFANAKGNFTITAGATPMVAGDGFTVTFYQGVGEYRKSATGNGDGSQTPIAILADDVDATSAAVQTGAYFMGEFNERVVGALMDATWTIQTLKAALAGRGIHLKSSVSAADPS